MSTSSHTSGRVLRTAMAGAILAILTVFALPTAASAHDQLVSSDPAADAQLDTAPTVVTLEFSAAIMDTGLAMTVVDADGADHLVDEPVADGTTVTANLDTLPVGGYQIRWRVVSSDGHPISGYVPFTVGDAEPLPTPTAGDDSAGDGAATGDTDTGEEDTAAGDHEHSTTPDNTQAVTTSSTDASAASDDSAVLRTVLIGAGGAVVAVGVLVLILVLNRRSRRNTDNTTDTTNGKSHS
ncbi:copper resistance CopC family protein [Microbacterium gorillae]|uniref:copper resistance CopC family protein n=1 Tax=Microbacterium gorillae TaxID=1231063 RepID=UPI003D98DD0A